MIYLITYELNSSKDYTSLYDVIKSYDTWWHYIDSAWLIETPQSTQQITDKLLPHVDKVRDNLLVIKVDKTTKQGWLPRKAWEWINNR